MIPATALLALLLLAPLQAKPEKKPEMPSPERIEATCKALEAAFAKGADPEAARLAVRDSVGVPDAKVVAVLDAKGLHSQDPALRGEVVETLGRMPHPGALAALHAALGRDKKELQKSPPALAALLRAIARHGDRTSIAVLTEDLFQSPDKAVATARILGLANVRARESVDELVKLMRSTRHNRVGDFMPEFRLALARLTGVDLGGNQELWLNWYGDHKSALAIEPEPAELPAELQRRWDRFWDNERPGRKRDKE